MTMKRTLTDDERQAILTLVQGLKADDKNQIIAELDNCTVEEATADGSRLTFFLAGYHRPAYRGQHAYDVGGAVNDIDGAEMAVTLYADENHRLLELELVKWDETSIIKPDWSTFRVLY